MRFTTHIKPNAQKNTVIRWFDETTCKISITAPPTDGQANKELLNFLSEILNIPKTSIDIIHGAAGKKKLIEIPDSSKNTFLNLKKKYDNQS